MTTQINNLRCTLDEVDYNYKMWRVVNAKKNITHAATTYAVQDPDVQER